MSNLNSSWSSTLIWFPSFSCQQMQLIQIHSKWPPPFFPRCLVSAALTAALDRRRHSRNIPGIATPHRKNCYSAWGSKLNWSHQFLHIFLSALHRWCSINIPRIPTLQGKTPHCSFGNLWFSHYSYLVALKPKREDLGEGAKKNIKKLTNVSFGLTYIHTP